MITIPTSCTQINPTVGHSPLGEQLLAHIENTRENGLAYDLVHPVMLALLATAAAAPFDPNERLEYQPFNNKTQPLNRSLLEAILLLTNPNQKPETQSWPSNPAEFGPHLRQYDSLDRLRGIGTEWVAAVLTAAGCNPWIDPIADDTLPLAVQLAIYHDMGGLLDRFLDCPGALPAQTIFDRILDPNSSFEHPLLNECIANNAKNSVIKILTNRGARIQNETQARIVFSQVAESLFDVIVATGVPAISEEGRKYIENEWRKRAKDKSSDLPTKRAQEMAHTLFGKKGASVSGSSLEIQKFLAVEWNKRPNGSSAYAYDFHLGLTLPEICERSTVKAGSFTGTWSVFAAAIAGRVRGGNAHRGASGWSPSVMLHRHYDEQKNSWIYADVNQPPYRGCLAAALDFDWKPGISINGIVALGLIGQRGHYDAEAEYEKSELEQDIKNFGLAANISDPYAWANQYSPDAAKFTLTTLKGNHANQVRAMLNSWSTAIRRQPAFVQALDDNTRADLLWALCGKAQLPVGWSNKTEQYNYEKKQFLSLANALFPGIRTELYKTDTQTQPPGPHRRAALILNLVLNPIAKTELMGGALLDKMEGTLDTTEIDIVDTWIKENFYSEESERLRARVKSWKLLQVVNTTRNETPAVEASAKKKTPKM